MAEQPPQQNTRDMAIVMLATLQRCAPPELDCALSPALPDQFLRIMHDFNGIPMFDLSVVRFIKVPPLALNKSSTLPKLLRSHGIVDKEDVACIRGTMEELVAHNREMQRVPKYYPLVWYPPDHDLSFMKLPMDTVEGGYIYALATLMPLAHRGQALDDELQQAYFGMVIGRLFSQVQYNADSTVHYAYYISDGTKLNLFMAVER